MPAINPADPPLLSRHDSNVRRLQYYHPIRCIRRFEMVTYRPLRHETFLLRRRFRRSTRPARLCLRYRGRLLRLQNHLSAVGPGQKQLARLAVTL